MNPETENPAFSTGGAGRFQCELSSAHRPIPRTLSAPLIPQSNPVGFQSTADRRAERTQVRAGLFHHF